MLLRRKRSAVPQVAGAGTLGAFALSRTGHPWLQLWFGTAAVARGSAVGTERFLLFSTCPQCAGSSALGTASFLPRLDHFNF